MLTKGTELDDNLLVLRFGNSMTVPQRELDPDLILGGQAGALPSTLESNIGKVPTDTFLLLQYYQDVINHLYGKQCGREREAKSKAYAPRPHHVFCIFLDLHVA